MASAAKRPKQNGKAQDAENGPGGVTGCNTGETGRERPVLGAQNGPRMDEDPVGPRHGVAGGPVGYQQGRWDGMGPHNSLVR